MFELESQSITHNNNLNLCLYLYLYEVLYKIPGGTGTLRIISMMMYDVLLCDCYWSNNSREWIWMLSKFLAGSVSFTSLVEFKRRIILRKRERLKILNKSRNSKDSFLFTTFELENLQRKPFTSELSFQELQTAFERSWTHNHGFW